jgi:hypothetical protein
MFIFFFKYTDLNLVRHNYMWFTCHWYSLKSIFSISLIDLPPDDAKWERNNSKTWPKLTYEDLVDYLINAKANDGKAMKSFRTLYGYNYVQNGWIGDIYSLKEGNIYFLKAVISLKLFHLLRTKWHSVH